MKVSVVLADDEPLILKGLGKLIPWEEHNIDIVAYAYDGLELLDAIQRHQPDMVISDISMPHLSGIDIIKDINERQLPTKVIFISAYQEFSYARDAVAYGAVDYLVKPIKKSEFEAVVAKALSMIHKEDEQDKRKNKLHLLERQNRNHEMGAWLEQLAEGALSELSEGYLVLKEKLFGPNYSVGIVTVDPMGNDSERWPMQTRKLVEFSIHNIVQELINDYGLGFSYIKNGQYVFIISHEARNDSAALAAVIKDNISTFLKIKVSVGVGGPVQRLIGLAESREQAEKALGMTFFAGLNQVIAFERHEQRKDSEQEWFMLQSKVIQDLTGGLLDEALASMEQLLVVIKSATISNRQLAVSTCFSCLLYIVQEVKKSNVPMSDLGFDIQHLQGRLDQYDTYADLCNGIYDLLQELYNRIGDQHGKKEQTLINRLVAYIEAHYTEDISLESVAAVAFMNPYYFSSFFKKHMNRNFKQYVTDLRMRQALALLKHTDLMVYEIAERVGYNNARHFSDMFKKQTGQLPQEFKNFIKNQATD